MRKGIADSFVSHIRGPHPLISMQMFGCVEETDGQGYRSKWLTPGSEALAPFYANEEWEWRPCTVLNFNPDTKMYRIIFGPDGPEKDVKRSNLLSVAECRETWQCRRTAAHESRCAAKQRLRFDFAVSQQPMDEVRAIQGSTIGQIHQKVADGLPMDMAFPEGMSKSGYLLRELTKEVIQQHTRSMKKSIFFHKVRQMHVEDGPSELGIVRPPKAPAVPWSSKVSVPGHLYEERHKAISNIHYCCFPEVGHFKIVGSQPSVRIESLCSCPCCKWPMHRLTRGTRPITWRLSILMGGIVRRVPPD